MSSLPVILAQTSDRGVQTPYGLILIGAVVAAIAFITANYLTRSGTIARATLKEAIRQPVFSLMIGLALLIIVANMYIPFFTMGSDTRVFIDCGLQTILICALLLSVWTASMSVADEIEGKTAMTLLSKPINRRQFILGKYSGIIQAALIMIAFVGFVLFVTTYFKFGYDQKEQGEVQTALFDMSAGFPYLAAERLAVALQILPVLALISFEVAVLTAVSVAISTRLPMLVNMVSCFAIFVVGHLTPVLVQETAQGGALVFVTFFAQLLATILPSVDLFNMSTAVSTGAPIPGSYLGATLLYCLAYCTAAVLLAFILFEDRDLA
ncbi:MAG: ABC transporter permease subunit [Planctomycetaceae bacterium]|nr:ABC transporter permease subunit [Planctomycetaceae bacterium]